MGIINIDDLGTVDSISDRLCCLVVKSSWLQIQRSGFDSNLERGPLILASTIEELFGRKSSGSGLQIKAVGDSPRWLRNTPIRKSWH
jgi:hypothetical protein